MKLLKKTIGVVALVAAGLSALVPASATASENRFAPILDSTLLLYSNDTSVCTAEFITEKLAVTAHHCVVSTFGGDENFSVHVPKIVDNKVVSKEIFYVSVKKKDPKRDLAILELKDADKKFTPVPLASDKQMETLVTGSPVLVFGYPGTMFRPQSQIFITDGRFLALREDFLDDTEGLFISTSAHAGPGMSGGAVYAEFCTDGQDPGDEDFVACSLGLYLIGVASQRDPTAEVPESVFVPVSSVQEALDKIEETPEKTVEEIVKKLGEVLEKTEAE